MCKHLLVVALGVVLLVLGLAEIGLGFALQIHRSRRGGGLAVGAVLTALIGALLLIGHASLWVAVVMAVLGQALVVASYLHLKRSVR